MRRPEGAELRLLLRIELILDPNEEGEVHLLHALLDGKRIARVETTRDLRSRFTLIPVSSSSPGCSFLPLHAPGARRLERTSEQNPSLGDRGGSRGQAARPVVRTIGLV